MVEPAIGDEVVIISGLYRGNRASIVEVEKRRRGPRTTGDHFYLRLRIGGEDLGWYGDEEVENTSSMPDERDQETGPS